ncbi:hypothetical protein PPYR_09567 [Photinus pyralis]|uniref:Uncharacterized protein n=4 Tax=Photinus pyralis TaxID=7054 RepID=A0A5N4AMN6_PHOPY|nr:hypothetical protein PPYR_09567 [Photinus pyralis]
MIYVNYLHFCQNLLKFRPNIQARLYMCTTVLEKEDDIEAPSINYLSSSNHYKIGRKHAAEKLQELFNLKPSDAIEVALRFNKLTKVMTKTITDNYDLLKQKHVPQEIILSYLDVLAEPNLMEKIKLLKPLSLPVSQLFPLLLMSVEDIKKFVNTNVVDKRCVHSGRIVYIATLLNISVYDAAKALLRKPFLRRINLDTLKQKIDFLLGWGITMEEISNDYWILAYNESMIKERIEFVKQCNVDKIKTWMVRAPIHILNR